MWKNRYCIVFIFFLFQNFANAQIEKAAIPLKEILGQMSAQHGVKFNFIQDEIVIFKIVPPPEEYTLQAKIEYIKEKTKLKFSVVDKKYYTIFNDQKVDKPMCGYLIDGETNLPIENASVQVVNTNAITSTNEQGYFELPIVSPNSIEFRHQSYVPKNIEARALYVEGCPNVMLTPFLQELIEVVANQYLARGISKKIDGRIEIKPKNFGLLPGLIEPDVLQTLQQIPGINSVDETISNINVRGGTHDQNLFLWNGIRLFQTGHFFGLISAFNPSLAHTISITKNGTSAFYGEGVSSIIDISTHAKTIEETKSSISTNLISSEFYSKFKTSKNGSIEVSGRRSLTDFISSPTYTNYRDRVFQNTIVTNLNSSATDQIESKENFYFYDLTLQYQQKIGKKHELLVDAITIRNNLSIDQKKSTAEKSSSLAQENFGGNMRWKTTWNEKNSSQIDLSGSHYNLDATNESIQNNQIFDQRNAVLNFGFQIRNTHQLSDNYIIRTGYQFDEISVTNSDKINTPIFSRLIREVSNTHIGVAEMQYQSINSNTFLKLGGRLNYFEKYNTTIFEPRLQWNQSIAKSLRIEVLAEQKSQTLSQIIDLQRDFLGIEKRRWTLANGSTIPIQKSTQYSIGLTFKNNSWLMTWDNFYKRVNGITTNNQGFQNQFEFSKEIGRYEVFGTELLIQRNFKKMYTWVSYSYNDNKYTFDQLIATDFPNNLDLSHSITAAIVYDWKQFKVALGGKWHSGKPITETLTNSINFDNPSKPKIQYDAPNNANLPDYFQLNFSAAKEWKISSKVNLQGSFAILNLLNKENVIQRYYRINASQDGIESVNTYALRRTPNACIKISF